MNGNMKVTSSVTVEDAGLQDKWEHGNKHLLGPL